MSLRIRIDDDFRHHDVSAEQGADLDAVRLACRETARALVERCSEGRELSTALAKLEEAMFWANAAVARGKA